MIRFLYKKQPRHVRWLFLESWRVMIVLLCLKGAGCPFAVWMSISLFFPQRRTFRLKNTVSYNTRLLVLFFEMKQFFFFVASKKIWKPKRFCLARNVFPFPALLWNSASDRLILWPWPWTLTMAWLGLTNHNQSWPNKVILFSYISSKITPKFSLFSRWRKFREIYDSFFTDLFIALPEQPSALQTKRWQLRFQRKKWKIFICKSRRMDVLKTAKA